jgi:hypothetical protein
MKPSLNVEVKAVYHIDTEVAGEDLPLISAAETWNSPAGLAHTASLNGGNVQSSFAPAQAPSAPPKAPSAPPVQSTPPKAPTPAPVVATDDSDAPDWLS